MRGAVWFILCAVIVCAAPCTAQIELALPLEGYYRPGQYMPVLIISGDQTAKVEIGQGMPTVLTPPANARTIVPVLMLDGAQRHLSWRSDLAPGAAPLPLTPLRDDQRLVGLARVDADDPQGHFPEHEVVTVQLGAMDPLPGWAGAWDALDAVVLAVIPRDAELLLAAGVRVIVPEAPELPAHALPLAGPTSARYDERVYLPTQGWRPAQPRQVRQLVLLMGVVFALLAMGVTLWRSRWQVALAALLVAGTVSAIELYRRGQPLAAERELLVVREEPGAPVDRWRWHKALRRTSGQSDFRGVSYPIFASASHLRGVAPRLRCDPRGMPQAIEWSLGEAASLALLMREPVDAAGGTSPEDEPSPLMLEMARRVYEGEGVEIVAEQGWVVVRPRERGPEVIPR